MTRTFIELLNIEYEFLFYQFSFGIFKTSSYSFKLHLITIKGFWHGQIHSVPTCPDHPISAATEVPSLLLPLLPAGAGGKAENTSTINIFYDLMPGPVSAGHGDRLPGAELDPLHPQLRCQERAGPGGEAW